MIKKNISYFILLCVSMTQWQGFSQERQDNAWKAIFVDYSLTNSRTLRLESHVRTRQFFAENDQYLLRPSIRFKLSKHTAFTTGVTFLSSNTPEYRTYENNIWQQFSFSFPIKKIGYFGWIRLEQRWQNKNDVGNYGARIRFRMGFQYPLSVMSSPSSTKVILFNEVFMNIQDYFPYAFNQNWTFIGFQKQFSKHLTILSGFQRNTIPKGTFYLHKNSWSSILFYTI